MPRRDPSIARLTEDERAVMAAAWEGRSKSEAGAVNAFEHIARALELLEAPAAVVRLARRAIADERRHIEIGRRVASAYSGIELPQPRLRTVRAPVYRGASPRVQALLRVIGQCCFNETTACAYARHALSIATAPLVRAALREITADEIDHARVGWAALAAAPPQLRNDIAAWIPSIIESHLAGWHKAMVEWPATLRTHGMPPRRDAVRVVDRTLEDLILPGLADFGVPVRYIAG